VPLSWLVADQSFRKSREMDDIADIQVVILSGDTATLEGYSNQIK